MNGRRIVLLGIAGLLSASALLAIAILVVGHFGDTERRILSTTMLLAGYGVVALPGAALLDRGHGRRLALATVALAAAGAALALAAVWSSSGSETLGKAIGTATAFAIAAAQTSALTARDRVRDPRVVRRLYAVSCGTALVGAAAATALLWTQPAANLYPRLFGALVVLDVLVVALQPILARARAAVPVHRFAIVLDSGETVAVSVEGQDLAAAAARAIRSAEHTGAHVVRLDVAA